MDGPFFMGAFAAERMWDRLAEAERHREVLADALREVVRLGWSADSASTTHALLMQRQATRGAEKALRECGLLRPQDDPAMIPAAWLPGAEEDEG